MPATTSRRDTRQRRVILELVEHSKAHPTAEEVYRLARKKLPTISLGTVYRNLGLLVEQGSIREVRFDDGVSRFDGHLEQHEHFVCGNCGTVIDLPRALDVKQLTKLASTIGSVTDYKLELTGVCKACGRK
jgi:Fe2+ or Zn2+ uptake regulation protein